jgi:allantoinase
MVQVLVCTGSKVLLPNGTGPVPATIVVDRSTGKIIDVRRSRVPREQLMFDSVEWIDAGDNIVLPGLIEYVIRSSHISHLTSPSFDI